ncbi:hypothetical protein PROFUN_11305 [Planoprotostelium fungivorum]|uniref:Uncharacterized protein n=1 Tax=Planoprotostelium fungivorum TaxID=1890364 RepID=A0A2P6N2J9_9EUKA|nr:hypothetical protein PROFUN_11305 [Planoprotostelium fungivorum]
MIQYVSGHTCSIGIHVKNLQRQSQCSILNMTYNQDKDKGLRALNQNSARTICIVFVNRDIYRWNQRSLLSQKQRTRGHISFREGVMSLMTVYPGVELPGLHGGVFSFFVRTNIAEKRRVPGLFSQFPRVEVRKLVVMPRALFGNSARKAIFHLGKVSGVELPGLHGGVFSFFVRTNIAEKRRAPGLFSQFPRVEVRLRALNQNSARTICIGFVNRDIYRWNQRSLLSQKQGWYQVIDDTSPRYKNTWATQKLTMYAKKIAYVRISGVISHLWRVPGQFPQFHG